MTRIRALLLAAALLGPALPAAAPAQAAAGGWPTYHLDNTRQANDSTEPAFATHLASGDWTFAPTTANDDEVFASPLVYAGHVFIATEGNVVYSVDEATGIQAWARQVATPVPGNSTYIGCSATQFGSTDGITGTPVIDSGTGVIYVVAMTPTAAAGHNSEFVLYGLRTSDGTPVLTTPLTATGLDPKFQNERAALGLANGYVYVTFGGRDGDCGSYHPWIMAAPIAGGAPLSFQPQTAGQNGGGMWAPSGMSFDGSGNLYVETGNGFESNCSNAWDYGDGVLKLDSTLHLLDSFHPTNWCSLNGSDTDMGSVGPLQLSNGEIFASGKSGDGWLLSAANLGGPAAGGQQFAAHISNCNTSDAVFGGFAYDGSRVFVPCDGHGLVALSVDMVNHTFATAWNSTNSGYSSSPGAPVLAGGVLWVEDQFGGNLYGFDPATGTQRYHFTMGGAHRFTTLAADGGRLIAMVSHGVQEFQFTSFTVAYTAYFPWYDDLAGHGFAQDNIHIVNPNGVQVLVNVSIPGSPSCMVSGAAIAAHQEGIFSCPTGFGGPVVVQASARVIATQRVKYFQSFNESAAQPAGASPTDLWSPWYDLASDPGFHADNVHVVNTGSSSATAAVSIPGCPTFNPTIAAGSYAILSCPGGFGGPVHITSSGSMIASLRVQYNQTFNEVAALPRSAAGSNLWMGWYDRISDAGFTGDDVHVVNPNATAATVSVHIPGCSGNFTLTLPAGQETFRNCPTGFGGPVTVTSTGTTVLASQRVKFYSSFNEVAAQNTPSGATSLYFPWFDDVSDPGFTSDNIHVVNTSAGTATATVTVPGCGAQPVTIGGGQVGIVTCSSIGGPVTVTSAAPMVAFQRVKYNQSFNEAAASP